jgi:hypothetical protein
MPVAGYANRKAITSPANLHRNAVLATAKEAGLLSGASDRIAGRIHKQLIDAARARSGIKSDLQLLEYAYGTMHVGSAIKLRRASEARSS